MNGSDGFGCDNNRKTLVVRGHNHDLGYNNFRMFDDLLIAVLQMKHQRLEGPGVYIFADHFEIHGSASIKLAFGFCGFAGARSALSMCQSIAHGAHRLRRDIDELPLVIHRNDHHLRYDDFGVVNKLFGAVV